MNSLKLLFLVVGLSLGLSGVSRAAIMVQARCQSGDGKFSVTVMGPLGKTSNFSASILFADGSVAGNFSPIHFFDTHIKAEGESPYYGDANGGNRFKLSAPNVDYPQYRLNINSGNLTFQNVIVNCDIWGGQLIDNCSKNLKH